jgi:hypothetical protein
MIRLRQDVPDHHSCQDFDSLGVGSSGTDTRPKAIFERPERSLDHGPSTVSAPEFPSVATLVEHHCLPRGSSLGVPSTHILAEVNHRPTASVGNRLSVVPREVALVEHERAEGELGRELREKSGQFGDVTGASIGDVGGEEEWELGSSSDERMEFDEDVT